MNSFCSTDVGKRQKFSENFEYFLKNLFLIRGSGKDFDFIAASRMICEKGKFLDEPAPSIRKNSISF